MGQSSVVRLDSDLEMFSKIQEKHDQKTHEN